MSEAEWQDFLSLEAHINDLLKDEELVDSGKRTKPEDVQLMSQAAAAFSGISQPLDVVQALIARVSQTQALLTHFNLGKYELMILGT